MDLTALVDSINRLLIGLDNLSAVADGAVAEFTAASGSALSLLGTASSNVTVQLGHLAEVTEAASANLTTQLAHLADVTAAASTNLTVQIGALIAALAPQAFNAAAANLQRLPGQPALQALPETPALFAHTETETPAAKKAAESEKVGANSLTPLMEAIGKGATVIGAAAAQAGTRLGGLTAPLNLFGSVVSNLAPIAGTLGPAFGVAGEAIGKVTQGFERVVGVMSQFAEVASPSIMFEFNRALRDLQATIGTAFTPFFQAMIGITRQVAGELFPAMQALQPVFASMASIVGGVLVPVANLFGNVLQTLLPVFSYLGTVVKIAGDVLGAIITPIVNVFAGLLAVTAAIMEPIMRVVGAFATLFFTLNPGIILLNLLGTVLGGLAKAVSAVVDVFSPFIKVLEVVAADVQSVFAVVGAIFSATIMTLVDAFKALLPGAFDLSKVFDFLKEATLTVAKALITLAVRVAALFGNTAFAANLIKSLQSLPGAGGKPYAQAAPQNVKTTSLESISREMAEASARSVGTVGVAKKDTVEDLTKELIKTVQDAQGGNVAALTDLKTQIASVVEEAAKTLGNAIVTKLGELISKQTPIGQLQGAAGMVYDRDRDSNIAGAAGKALLTALLRG